MGKKNTFSDHFFSEEALSEEQLIRKSGETEEEVIRKIVKRYEGVPRTDGIPRAVPRHGCK